MLNALAYLYSPSLQGRHEAPKEHNKSSKGLQTCGMQLLPLKAARCSHEQARPFPMRKRLSFSMRFQGFSRDLVSFKSILTFGCGAHCRSWSWSESKRLFGQRRRPPLLSHRFVHAPIAPPACLASPATSRSPDLLRNILETCARHHRFLFKTACRSPQPASSFLRFKGLPLITLFTNSSSPSCATHPSTLHKGPRLSLHGPTAEFATWNWTNLLTWSPLITGIVACSLVRF